MDYDEAIAAVHVFNDLVDAEEQADVGVPRRFYGKEDAFDLSDRAFIKNFRLNKQLTRELIEIVRPYIAPPSRRSALSVENKVLVSLIFYGYGTYQEGVGKNLFAAVSQPSVSRCLHEVTAALIRDEVLQRFINFPRNIQELRELRTRFYRKYQLPGAVGCVDGTHIAIVPPNIDEHIYVNRKHYHSLNVQLVCDENLRIMSVNARYPGSSHDAFVFRHSQISTVMERIHRNVVHDNFFLLGDSGYPLRPWIITPIRDPPPGTAEERFNDQFKSVRSIIERCNGVLKNRFRCLLRHRVLHYAPENAANIINACAVLHNMCVQHNVPEPNADDLIGADFGMYDYDPVGDNNELLQAVNPDLAAGRNLRARIVATHFQQR